MSSFVGAIAIADLVKTTLGPKGMDKILQSVGGTTFTMPRRVHVALLSFAARRLSSIKVHYSYLTMMPPYIH